MCTKEQKDIAFYSAVVQAWITTRMERDKVILAISAAGLGWLVTIVTTVGIADFLTLIFFVAAVVSFTAVSVLVVLILGRNAEYLERVARNQDEPDRLLARLDTSVNILFISGVVSVLLMGLLAGYAHYEKELTRMAEEQQQQPVKAKIQESVQGITNLRSKGDTSKEFKSVNNVANLKPAGTVQAKPDTSQTTQGPTQQAAGGNEQGQSGQKPKE